MGRLLEALQRIEDLPDRPARTPAPLTPDDLARFGIRQREKAAPEEPPSKGMVDKGGPASPPASDEAPSPDTPGKGARRSGTGTPAGLGKSDVAPPPDDQITAPGETNEGRAADPADQPPPAGSPRSCPEDTGQSAPDSPGGIDPACGGPLAKRIREQLGQHPAGTLLVTCSADGPGSRKVSAGLARTIARELGEPALLVDADLRPYPDGPPAPEASQPGLANVLAQQKRWEEVVLPADRPGVSRMPAGDGTAVEERCLTQARLAELFGQFRARYPWVVLSTGSVAQPEATALATLCDGVCLAVLLGQTPRRAAIRAARTLKRSSAKLLGWIVVKPRPDGP